jgi:hypothetical protein
MSGGLALCAIASRRRGGSARSRIPPNSLRFHPRGSIVSGEQSHSARQTPAFRVRKCRCMPRRRPTKPQERPGSAERSGAVWNCPTCRDIGGGAAINGQQSPGSAALVAIWEIRGEAARFRGFISADARARWNGGRRRGEVGLAVSRVPTSLETKSALISYLRSGQS